MKKLLFLIPLFFSSFSNAVVCPGGQVDSGGVCVSACSILQGDTRTYTYDSYIWGDAPTSFCFGSRSGSAACKMEASGSIVSNVPSGSRFWSRSFTFSGAECAFDEINRYFGDSPASSDFELDRNMNGILDAEEDWDGDGIKNGEDPNPSQNDNIDLDENDNDIPDNLEPYYDKLSENRPEVIRCSDDSPDCNSHNQALYSLSVNNRELGETIRWLSHKSVTHDRLDHSLQDFAKSVYQQHEFTRGDILLNRALIQAKNTGGVDNSGIINSGFSNMVSEFKDVDNLFSKTMERFDDVDYNQDYANRTFTSLFDSVNGVHGHLDATETSIISAINSSGGEGLTSQQKTQLANAAKAKNNQNLIKKAQASLDNLTNLQGRLEAGVQGTQMIAMTIADDVNENTDARFNELSTQIAAISSADSTIDLSGVEDSISLLSDKIDGLEGGTDTAPSGGSCDSRFTCSGNTYECYLARQAFETKCLLLANDDDILGVSSAQTTLDSLNSSLSTSLKNVETTLETTSKLKGDGKSIYLPETDVSELLDTYNQDNGGLNFDNNSCPAPIQLNFLLAGQKQVNIELSLEWLCELALYVRAMLMLGAAMISGRIWFQNY